MPLIDDIFDDSYIDEEIAAYIDFMDDEENDNTGFLKKRTIDEHYEQLAHFLDYYIWYPDYFVDLMVPSTSHFNLFPFQRIMMRGMVRGKGCFETFSRGTSKSFLADLVLYLLCMFYPNFHCSITAGTNKQGAEIAKQKVVGDLWPKFPLLANEMKKRRVAGKLLDPYHMQKDYVEFAFTNGSSLQIGAVRGLRFEALIFEEVIEQDEIQINEVYIPTLNRPRAMSNGLVNQFEVQGRQIYITTAGYSGTFAYNKMIDILCNSVLDPDLYFVFTGTYKIPLYHGLTAKKQIEDVISSPAFSKSSFEREYESRWSDAPAGAAFSANVISSLRQVKMVELKDKLTAAQKEQDYFYVICADMAKDGAAETAVGVAKVIPKEHYFTYKFINLFTIPSTDYMVIANTFKKTVLAYNAKLLIYDANGVKEAPAPQSIFHLINEVNFENQNLPTAKDFAIV